MTKDKITIDKGIISLQSKIGLPDDFFKNLLNEDDWSFIIKLHALIESIVTSLIVFHFNEPNIKSVISRLEMSNRTTGKLAFLKATGLLGANNLKYIYALSELRNKFVHSIESCSISLPDWISKFDSNQMKSFALSFGPLESTILDINKKVKTKGHDFLIDGKINSGDIVARAKINPKFHIWIGAYNLLVAIADSYYYSDYLQSIKANKLDDEEREIL
ncbi:MAG: hypothetical protein KAX28_04335 [Candidatus Marinimicrobia bacterium]|nr:hypothetical protein [Candidatus Neomarinimicrobiota bacterium]